MIDPVKLLPVKHISKSVEEAKSMVNEERSGKQLGLYCRYPRLNGAMSKYWRFGKVTLIGGMSSSGKSTLLNILEDDFTNTELNKGFTEKVIVLAFKYEMEGVDEVLRNVSGKLNKSYSALISSEYTKDKGYNNVSDSEFETISIELDKLKSKPIYYVEIAGNLSQLRETYLAMKDKFKEAKFIVSIDHTLLSKKLNESTDAELMQATAFEAIRLKKEGVMVLLIGQLNANIEDVKRRENPQLHYPIKTDIHCANQLFWACDNVMVFHRPELLGIKKYGSNKKDTNKLIHLAFIKGRFGTAGNIWLQEDFARGTIIEPPPINITT